MVYFIFAWYFMVLYGTSWDLVKIFTGSMCPRPFCCASHCGCSSPVQPKPLEISQKHLPLTKQTCLSKVLSIFKGPGKGSTHVFDTRILHLSAFTSLASVFPQIHRISVQPSQETLKDHHAVCKIYHVMLLMDKILQTNFDSWYWLILVNPWITVIPSGLRRISLHQAYHPNLLLNVLSLIRVFSSSWGLRSRWSFTSCWGSWKSWCIVHRIIGWSLPSGMVMLNSRHFAVSSLSAGFGDPKVWRCLWTT